MVSQCFGRTQAMTLTQNTCSVPVLRTRNFTLKNPDPSKVDILRRFTPPYRFNLLWLVGISWVYKGMFLYWCKLLVFCFQWVFTLLETNMARENGPFWRCISYWTLGDFPASHVSFQILRVYLIFVPSLFVSFWCLQATAVAHDWELWQPCTNRNWWEIGTAESCYFCGRNLSCFFVWRVFSNHLVVWYRNFGFLNEGLRY